MADTDQIGSRSVRMTADEINQRGFATKVRGLSETDVRSFLKRVAEEVDRLGKREDELLAKIKSLQEDLTAKPKATKSQLLEILGEQTTRVLSSAEQAAEQMISEAKEQSEQSLKNAKEQSEQLITKAKEKSDETIEKCEAKAKAISERAQREADTVLSQARSKGRELFQESVVVREQILKDLLKRRDLLLDQIEELRNGREELLDSYKVVKSSFQKATDALQSVEQRANGELMQQTIDVDELLKSPVELPKVLDSKNPGVSDKEADKKSESGTDDQSVTTSSIEQSEDAESKEQKESKIYDYSANESKEESEVKEISITGKRKSFKNYVKEALGSDVSSEPENKTESNSISVQAQPQERLDDQAVGIGDVKTIAKKKDVGALFQSLKEQNGSDQIEPKSQADSSDSKNNEDEIKEPASIDLTAEEEKKPSKEKSSTKKDPVALRDDAISGITTTILRKAKRQLQDEQNELLDTLRTVKPKKRVSSDQVLMEEQTQIKTWIEASRSELEEAFNQGAKTVSSKKTVASDEMLKNTILWVISPLREALAMAIDEGDSQESGSRVGAKYREWRNSNLKSALTDALCCAYNNGVLSAVDSDATMKWQVEKSGQCPDCDDNALEPTTAGEAFPTGQIAPPAHPGCRCVITVA